MKVATTQINRTFTNTTDMYMVVRGARNVLFASRDEGECNAYFNAITEAQAEDLGVIKILVPHEEWSCDFETVVYYDTPEEAAKKAADKQRLEEIGSAAFFAEMIK